MGYAFISYSTKNQSLADSMRQLLHKNGIATWMAPADIPAGSKYAQVINQAIKNCACVILMLSDAAQNSPWVAKEIERAVSHRKVIIPVQLEDLVLNDDFEFYISTDQIVAVKQLDGNSPEINKILASVRAACGSTSVDTAHDTIPTSPSADEASAVQYRLSLSASDSGSLFIYSAESLSNENTKSYTLKEGEWAAIRSIIAEYVALLYHTTPEFVEVTLHDTLNGKKCAPLNGHSYYDKQFRINFGISYITPKPSEIYDSAHIDVSNLLSLTFFKKGSYIYHTVPADSTLADIGLDEKACIELSKKLLRVLHPKKTIVCSESFESKVYSDCSGGFKLRYLAK